jgi:hypothetical protein
VIILRKILKYHRYFPSMRVDFMRGIFEAGAAGGEYVDYSGVAMNLIPGFEMAICGAAGPGRR